MNSTTLHYRHSTGITTILAGHSLDIPDWLSTRYPGQRIALADTNLLTILKTSHPALLDSFHAIIPIPDGESSKSFTMYETVIGRLAGLGADRQTTLAAIGGGVTGDLTGFVAATYLRGIRYVQIPTTLLSQIDSSIGGKTGINIAAGKNLVGAFWQPDSIVADASFLQTLPAAEVTSALGELLKYVVLFDGDEYNRFEHWLTLHQPTELLDVESDQLTRWISACIGYKTRIVEADEKESGPRALLNLGHTLGHALEKLFQYPALRHGDAVTIGTAFASSLSCATGRLSPEDRDRIIRTARLLVSRLPADGHWNPDQVLDYISRDKKKAGSAIRWILPLKPGLCEIVPIDNRDLIINTLQDFPDVWNHA